MYTLSELNTAGQTTLLVPYKQNTSQKGALETIKAIANLTSRAITRMKFCNSFTLHGKWFGSRSNQKHLWIPTRPLNFRI